MKTTRRSLFGLLAGTGVATLAGGASAMSGSVAEKPGQRSFGLQGRHLCDYELRDDRGVPLRTGCGQVFDIITTAHWICPHCCIHYQSSREYMNERAAHPNEEPRVWTTQLWIDERKRNEDRWSKA